LDFHTLLTHITASRTTRGFLFIDHNRPFLYSESGDLQIGMEPARNIILIEAEFFPALVPFIEAARAKNFYIAAVYPTARQIGTELVDEACNRDDPVWEDESEVFAVIPSEEGLSVSSERFMNAAFGNSKTKPVFLLSSHVEELTKNFDGIHLAEWRRHATEETASYLSFIPRRS
jgi:hypothetical protein